MAFKYQLLVVSLLITSSLGQDVDVGHLDDFENDVNHDFDNTSSSNSRQVTPKPPEHPYWGYEDQDSWPEKFPMCGGSSQSPININRTVDDKLTLDFGSYESKISKVKIWNTGHTVQFDFKSEGSSPRPTVTGSVGWVDDPNFLFTQGHFHWGSNNTIGSEHAINGTKFPVEMHLVHYNERYSDFEEAKDKQDGLLAVAVFFQVSETSNPNLTSLFSLLNQVRCNTSQVYVKNAISLSSFLPDNRREFYRYQGSLTTPPCFESVTWIVLNQIVPIGQGQLRELRKITSDKYEICETPIGNNWRKLQKRNRRKVSYASGPE